MAITVDKSLIGISCTEPGSVVVSNTTKGNFRIEVKTSSRSAHAYIQGSSILGPLEKRTIDVLVSDSFVACRLHILCEPTHVSAQKVACDVQITAKKFVENGSFGEAESLSSRKTLDSCDLNEAVKRQRERCRRVQPCEASERLYATAKAQAAKKRRLEDAFYSKFGQPKISRMAEQMQSLSIIHSTTNVHQRLAADATRRNKVIMMHEQENKKPPVNLTAVQPSERSERLWKDAMRWNQLRQVRELEGFERGHTSPENSGSELVRKDSARTRSANLSARSEGKATSARAYHPPAATTARPQTAAPVKQQPLKSVKPSPAFRRGLAVSVANIPKGKDRDEERGLTRTTSVEGANSTSTWSKPQSPIPNQSTQSAASNQSSPIQCRNSTVAAILKGLD